MIIENCSYSIGWEINDALYDMMEYVPCIVLYELAVDRSTKIKNVYLGSNTPGAYNPVTRSMSFADLSSVREAFPEEFIHFSQDMMYRFGIRGYMSSGKCDIEFEAKVIQDLALAYYVSCPYRGIGKEYGDQYIEWILAHSADWPYPGLMLGIDELRYNDFLMDFSLKNPEYGSPVFSEPELLNAFTNY